MSMKLVFIANLHISFLFFELQILKNRSPENSTGLSFPQISIDILLSPGTLLITSKGNPLKKTACLSLFLPSLYFGLFVHITSKLVPSRISKYGSIVPPRLGVVRTVTFFMNLIDGLQMVCLRACWKYQTYRY